MVIELGSLIELNVESQYIFIIMALAFSHSSPSSPPSLPPSLLSSFPKSLNSVFPLCQSTVVGVQEWCYIIFHYVDRWYALCFLSNILIFLKFLIPLLTHTNTYIFNFFNSLFIMSWTVHAVSALISPFTPALLCSYTESFPLKASAFY